METIHKKSIRELKDYLNCLNSNSTYGNDGKPRFLFRGQTRDYGNIKPTFSRVADDKILGGQSYTIYRYAKNLFKGLYDYNISDIEAVAIAILQHYGTPSPQIDLTANTDIAIYFATEVWICR